MIYWQLWTRTLQTILETIDNENKLTKSTSYAIITLLLPLLWGVLKIVVTSDSFLKTCNYNKITHVTAFHSNIELACLKHPPGYLGCLQKRWSCRRKRFYSQCWSCERCPKQSHGNCLNIQWLTFCVVNALSANIVVRTSDPNNSGRLCIGISALLGSLALGKFYDFYPFLSIFKVWVGLDVLRRLYYGHF